MSNDIRNNTVVNLNLESSRIKSLLSSLKLDLPNIVETERNKIFQIIEELESYKLNLWDDGFVLRDAILCYFSLKVISSLEGFKNLETSFLDIFKTKDAFLKPAVDHYIKCNNDINSFNLREDFYKIACNYSQAIYPASKYIGEFFDMYDSFYAVSDIVDPVENDEYNDSVLLDILGTKEADCLKLSRIDYDSDIDDISDEEFFELLDIGINNFMQMLKTVNEDEFENIQKKINSESYIRNRTR